MQTATSQYLSPKLFLRQDLEDPSIFYLSGLQYHRSRFSQKHFPFSGLGAEIIEMACDLGNRFEEFFKGNVVHAIAGQDVFLPGTQLHLPFLSCPESTKNPQNMILFNG